MLRTLYRRLSGRPWIQSVLWNSRWSQRVANAVLPYLQPRTRFANVPFRMRGSGLNTAWHLSASGAYEPEVTEFIRSVLRPGMTAVDVGANEGYYSLLMSGCIGPTGRVLAIEPDPAALRWLNLNLRDHHCTNVAVLPLCVGDGQSQATLYTSGISGINSLTRRNVRGPTTSVQVGVQSLDATLEQAGIARIDVLKVDVQGADVAVLRGAKRILADAKLTLALEFWPQGIRQYGDDPREFFSLLRSAGFAVRCLDRPDLQPLIHEPEPFIAALERSPDMYRGYVNVAAERA